MTTEEEISAFKRSFERTCRYGHGLLQKAGMDEGDNTAFVLQSVDVSGTPTLRNKGMLLQAWECSVCGYVEMSELPK
jgi:hypothetical protein